MEIQQWVGLIGVVLYWLFRAYTGAKKNASKTSRPQNQTNPKPKSFPAPMPEPTAPAPDFFGERKLTGQNSNSWTEFEEIVPFNYDTDEAPSINKAVPTGSKPERKTSSNWIKSGAFEGRDAIIYQAIMNRPMH